MSNHPTFASESSPRRKDRVVKKFLGRAQGYEVQENSKKIDEKRRALLEKMKKGNKDE
jgi:hypothetical protein